MNDTNEENNIQRQLINFPAQAENPAFERAEMPNCAACGRANPPTRLRCLYCAAELPVAEKYRNGRKYQKLNLRKLEDWEKGWNLIFAGKTSDNIKYAEISELLNLESEIVEKITGSSKNLPLLRAETEREAQIVGEQLLNAGIAAKIISDESLKSETEPRRLRGMNFDANKINLILFGSGENVEISAVDLILIVSGAIYERRAEIIEKRKRRESQIVETSETASDEILLDIYVRGDETGYRILTKGFDFSGLGAAKGLIAAENLKKIAARIRAFAPNAKSVDDYPQVREILGSVWEIENRREAQGLTRHNFNKFDLTKVESSSNLRQFTKYSRLQMVYEKV